MKVQAIILLLFLAAPPLMAQDAISEYFRDYTEQEAYKTVYVTKRMFSLAAKVAAGADDPELEKAISQIDGLKSISSEDYSRASFRQFEGQIPEQYDILMRVREKGEQTAFWVKTGRNDRVEELLMLEESEGRIVLVSIFGIIDLNQLAKLARQMNIGGLEKLERLEEE